MHLTGFIIELYDDARPYERQSIQLSVPTKCSVLKHI